MLSEYKVVAYEKIITFAIESKIPSKNLKHKEMIINKFLFSIDGIKL